MSTNVYEYRTYKEVLDSVITLAKVTRIENTGYDDSISGKGADFTSESIEALIKKGRNDALKRPSINNQIPQLILDTCNTELTSL
jgi:hypothetical protein